MKNILLTLILVFSVFSGRAQNTFTNPLQSIPPSPDAAALGKYGQYPVNMSSGLVKINIPIYTVELPGLTLPISLSYHPSGIKVNDIASMVGIGWSLNAGGVITRSVRGLPDSKFGSSGIKDEEFISSLGPNGKNEETKFETLEGYYNGELRGTYDYESDVYYYNMGEVSGSFRFDIKGRLVQTPLSNNRIEYDSNKDQFVIIDTNGTTYTFNCREKSITQGDDRYTSSWYLSHIKTIEQKEIYLGYDVDTTVYTDYYESYCLKIAQIIYGAHLHSYNQSYVKTDNTLRLTTIQFPGGTVRFGYSADRTDKRKYRLNLIRIVDNQGQNIKRFSLIHNYLGGRLNLDKIILESSIGAQIGKYSFGYYKNATLPAYYDIHSTNRAYYGQDLWGYYNGITTNKYLLTYKNKSLSQTYPPANRSVKPEYAKAGILTEIKYPTGGRTVFEYESNQNYSGEIIGGFRIKNIISYSDENSLPTVKSYQYRAAISNYFATPENLMGASYTQSEPVPESDGTYNRMFDYYLTEPHVPLSASGASPVFYDKVTEFDGYPENCNGKTEYSFLRYYDNVEYYPLSHCTLPAQYKPFLPKFHHMYDGNSWAKTGEPTQVDVFKRDNGVFSLVKSTEYQYRMFNEQWAKVGFRAFSNFTNGSRWLYHPFQHGPYNVTYLYQYTNIYAKTGLVELTQVKETDYLTERAVTKTTNYFYKLKNQHMVSSIYEVTSEGRIRKKNYQYPNDLKASGNIYELMSNRNVIAPVIIETDSMDNNFLQYTKYQYRVKQLSNFPEIMVTPSAIITKRTNSSHEKYEVYYNHPDSKGNICEVVEIGGKYKSIIWGYNQTYPVAVLENIQYSSISSTLMDFLNQLQNYSTNLTDENIRNSLKTLNESIRSNAPANVMITTYTYKPLLGITSETDPSGKTIYYEYDTYGRLERKYYMEGNAMRLIQSFEYKYKN